jgi:hypothetical protein
VAVYLSRERNTIRQTWWIDERSDPEKSTRGTTPERSAGNLVLVHSVAAPTRRSVRVERWTNGRSALDFG